MNMNNFSGENYICYKCNYKYNINLTYLYSYQLQLRSTKRTQRIVLKQNTFFKSFESLKDSYFPFKQKYMIYQCSVHKNILFFNRKKKLVGGIFL